MKDSHVAIDILVNANFRFDIMVSIFIAGDLKRPPLEADGVILVNRTSNSCSLQLPSLSGWVASGPGPSRARGLITSTPIGTSKD